MADQSTHEKGQDQVLNDLLQQAATPQADTIDTLMEVCESIERSYQAAVMAGEIQPSIAASTNYR